jgi:hypothetical protein
MKLQKTTHKRFNIKVSVSTIFLYVNVLEECSHLSFLFPSKLNVSKEEKEVAGGGEVVNR